MTLPRACAIALPLALAALPALAQSNDTPQDAPVTVSDGLTFGSQNGQRAIFFSAFLGVQTSPAYFGSDEMTFGPSFRAGLGAVDLGWFRYGSSAKDPVDPYQRRQGFGYGMSFRFIQARNSDDYDELEGLDDIDPTFEIGGVIGYAWPNVEAVLDTRYGIGGSDAWVSEARLNYVARPTDKLAIRVGPRLFFGSQNYTDTYFGVTPKESAASGLPAYDPDGGLVSAGLEVIATYQLNDKWWLEGAARWDRYQDDAANSPITQQGSEDWTQIRIGLRRNFAFRF